MLLMRWRFRHLALEMLKVCYRFKVLLVEIDMVLLRGKVCNL